MGMYDNLYVDYPLPKDGFQDPVFQTKSITLPNRWGCNLDFFRLRGDGLLVKLGDYDDENVLADEQHRETKGGWICEEFSGDIFFYHYWNECKGKIEFKAVIEEGRVQSIELIEHREP